MTQDREPAQVDWLQELFALKALHDRGEIDDEALRARSAEIGDRLAAEAEAAPPKG